jgi:murein DD-endopeptidase MepM/ murein hydrolase activator NlpD
MAAWTLTTATYIAFREDVLTRLISRQTEMQFGYEDRIAELRAQVDRMSSRQLLDQEQYEQKLEQVVRRQTALESRAAALNGLPDPTVTGTVKPPQRNETPRATPFKPSPINDTSLFAPSDRGAWLPGPRADTGNTGGGVDGVLVRLQKSLDRVEARQTTALKSLEESYDAKVRRMHGVLTDIGIDPGKIAPRGTGEAIGGPFVAARPPADAGTFERQIYRVSIARAQAARLMQTLGSVPVRKPVMGEIDLSSGFGVRIDPFIRAPAMHTGLDFRGDPGDPVRVTANGKVTVAGWFGGYGKMVEVDHGNGFVTRYGHLSSIDTRVGQTVRTGQIVGRMGSTGRSTGPHLHYETRVDGEAVDPQKFLRAGARLGTVN